MAANMAMPAYFFMLSVPTGWNPPHNEESKSSGVPKSLALVEVAFFQRAIPGSL